MYNEALKKIIKDLVNICGYDFDKNEAIREIGKLKDIIAKKEKKYLNSDNQQDIEEIKFRIKMWEKSPTYIGNKIIEDYANHIEKEKIIQEFDMLFNSATKAFELLNRQLYNSDIFDYINQTNSNYNTIKTKKVERDNNKTYSQMFEHYNQKRAIIENIIISLKEKKDLTESTLKMLNDIKNDISIEIDENKEMLLEYSAKEKDMSNMLFLSDEYSMINEEIDKLREIKNYNETQLKNFNEEIDKYKKEQKNIELELKSKEEELKEVKDEIEKIAKDEENGRFVSKENLILNDINVKEESKKLKMLNNQKEAIYVDLNKIKEIFEDIINKKNSNVLKDDIKLDANEKTELNNYMENFNLSKEEAIKIIELDRKESKSEEKLKGYMNEFGFTKEEATKAIKNEEDNKFWNPE